MYIRFLLLVVTLLLVQPAITHQAEAQIEGTYNMRGTNPTGGGTYFGTVEITRTGDTFSILWQIGDQSFEGTGIFRDGLLSVSFGGEFGGIVVYRMSSSGGKGVWAPHNSTDLGTENLQR